MSDNKSGDFNEPNIPIAPEDDLEEVLNNGLNDLPEEQQLSQNANEEIPMELSTLADEITKQQLSQSVNGQMPTELSELAEQLNEQQLSPGELPDQIKELIMKLQRRRGQKKEQFSIIYDRGTKRTQYTSNLNQAVEWYMEKVMGVSVRVEESMKLGNPGAPRNYIYARVVELNKEKKLSKMCKGKNAGAKKDSAEPAKMKRTHSGEENPEPPAKVTKKEEQPSTSQGGEKVLMNFLMLRVGTTLQPAAA